VGTLQNAISQYNEGAICDVELVHRVFAEAFQVESFIRHEERRAMKWMFQQMTLLERRDVIERMYASHERDELARELRERG
jgi:hypothetical protein